MQSAAQLESQNFNIGPRNSFFIVSDLPLIRNLAPKISLSYVGCGTGFIQTSWKCVQ
jgi:hypothetical protein